MIVEDDPAIAELIAWALDDAGFDVRVAPTMSEALVAYEEGIPDLVVADLLLPDGTGSDLVRRVRERRAHERAATMVMSAHPQARERALDAGADACLPKPFDLDAFFTTVERITSPRPQLAGTNAD